MLDLGLLILTTTAEASAAISGTSDSKGSSEADGS
jgi:hypothetical protein